MTNAALHVARTGLDLARRRPLHQSLVAIDAVLSRVGARELRATMARLEWVYDLPSLSLAVNSGDPLSESPLESMSRGWMYETGVQQPLLQQWVTGASGKRYRVDFLWPGSKVVGVVLITGNGPAPKDGVWAFCSGGDLALTLPLETWVRFLIWMGLGFLIYFLYGYKRSRLAGSSPEDSGYPSMTST